MSAEPTARLLIVDDEAPQMKALCDVLSVESYRTDGFTSAGQALQALREREFDLLLTDLMMPEMDGIALLNAAAAIQPDLLAIVMTGHATIETAVKAMQAGALDYIVKPFKLNVILPVLNRALAVRALRLENRRLEQHVAERTRELETANRQLEAVNRELESFSYSVSHDLRAPLRTVQSFCQMYMEDFSAGIPAEGLRLLGHVVAGAERMGELIEDLLALSKLGRQPLRRRPVRLDELAKRIIAGLRAKEPDRTFDIRIGELGTCDCDPSLIEQVLVNLLANAFKFTRGRQPAKIEFDRLGDGAETTYRIGDNGAGFDMRYADRLFGVFQRLHSNEEFEDCRSCGESSSGTAAVSVPRANPAAAPLFISRSHLKPRRPRINQHGAASHAYDRVRARARSRP
jgi:two-component system, sensor histidine kinase and response regulator